LPTAPWLLMGNSETVG